MMLAAGISMVAALGGSGAAEMSTPIQIAQVSQYYVYCIGDTTSVEQWDLEQMKVRRGSDVCLLHTDTSASGAQDGMEKNFPTKACHCDN